MKESINLTNISNVSVHKTYINTGAGRELDVPKLIQEHCNNVNETVAITFFIVGLMWAAQPMVYQMIDKNVTKENFNDPEEWAEIFKIAYKYSGIGILFVVGAIWMVIM